MFIRKRANIAKANGNRIRELFFFFFEKETVFSAH